MLRGRLGTLNPALIYRLVPVIPLLVVGIALGMAGSSLIEKRSLEGAQREASAIARTVMAPNLSARDLRRGTSGADRRRVRRALRPLVAAKDLLGVRVWNRRKQVVYVDRRVRGAEPSTGPLASALRGEPSSKVLERPKAVDAYVPLEGRSGKRSLGAVEVYLPHGPVAAAAASDSRKLYLALIAGLALLYVALLRMVSGASARLRRQAAEQEHQALHDPLTGLPNRTLFRKLAEDALAARPRDGMVAVILMDFDRFKEINDTLGHFNGDLVIKRAAKRLAALVRDCDAFARLGGDEFAMLLPGLSTRESVTPVVTRVREALKEPFVAAGLALEVEASIGIAVCPDNGMEVNDLLRAADVAMYAAKRAHTGYEFYAPDQHHYSPSQLGLVAQLRRAMERNELVLHYQPKAALDTGAVAGVEALVRWNHPHQGLLFPDAFIPVAEHTSLIRPLTLHLLERAISEIRNWETGQDVTLAVNLSTQMLLDLELPGEIARMLSHLGANTQMLEVEVTESSIMYDPRRAKVVLERLHDRGIRIAIDDFGTGYSSLVSLKQLPVSTIKIDKSFVMGMDKDEDDAAIVKSTVQLAHSLGLQSVAEGMETADNWSRLAAFGCDYGQGYYLSKPLAGGRFIQWLSAYREIIANRRQRSDDGVSKVTPLRPAASRPR
jgi:diguanylate cyclase (GGDEF)-like protein